ncbi:unnamed protein product [Discula destructiva]
MVCEGAATSEACAMSSQEFFRRGAALAIQSYPREGKYNTNADILFYGTRTIPDFLMDGEQLEITDFDVGSPVEIEFSSYAHSRFRLVCDPLYQRNCQRYTPGCISILSDDASENNNCYDVWDMSRYSEAKHAIGMHANGAPFSIRIPPGRYLVEVEDMVYHENGTDATLRLYMTRKAGTGSTASRHLRARNAAASQQAYTFDVPLTSCGPSNLVLLDLDLVKKRLWKPRPGRTQPAQLSLLDPELLLDDETPTPASPPPPPAKRQRTAMSPRAETSAELYAVDWASAVAAPQPQAREQGSSRGGRVSPSVAKQEGNTGSPTLSEAVRPTGDEHGLTFELEESSDSEGDAQSTGSGDSENAGQQIDFRAFPIITGLERQGGEQPQRLGLLSHTF